MSITPDRVVAESVSDFRSRARTWLDTNPLPAIPADYADRARVLRQWHQTLYAAGWLGVQWPTDAGGQGLTMEHQLAFSAELARARAPQPVGSIGLEVVGPTILKYGSPAQRERFLPPLLAGNEVWCQGFSEPDAGSDLAALRTRGTVTGDHIVISGQKVWTSWATDADWCAVLVRSDPDAPRHNGISYVLVDMKSPGVTVRPITMLNGDAEFNEVFYDDVRVPLDNVLGELGQGWTLAMDTLGWERAGYAIRRRNELETMFDTLLDQLRGTPDNADTARELGHVYCEMRAFRALAQHTSRRLVSGDVPSPYDSIDKLLLARTEQILTGAAFDLLGPHRGDLEGHDDLDADHIVKSYLYGRAASVYGGSSQIQRTIIAERLLGLPRGR